MKFANRLEARLKFLKNLKCIQLFHEFKCSLKASYVITILIFFNYLQYKCCGVDDSNDIPASVAFPPECCPAGQSCTRGGPNAYPVCFYYMHKQIHKYTQLHFKGIYIHVV